MVQHKANAGTRNKITPSISNAPRRYIIYKLADSKVIPGKAHIKY
jgi:hypothetical protein